MAGKLAGRVAAVTGSGRGLGRAYAHALAAQGAALAVNDVDGDVAQQVADEIREGGGRAVADVGSIAEPAGAQRLVDAAVEAFGHLDVMVTNAGADRRGPVVDLTPEDWAFTLGVHLFGSIHCATAAARAMLARGGGGSIVIVTSPAFYAGTPNLAPYCVAKGGTYGLLRVLAAELGPQGISVNGVAPPLTATGPVQAFLASLEGVMPPDQLEAFKASAQDPADVAPIVAWLATDEGRRINGQLFTMTRDELTLITPPGERDAHHATGTWTLEEIDEVMPTLLGTG